jgi:DNA repair exonuclease SbcCD ATPase subunit
VIPPPPAFLNKPQETKVEQTNNISLPPLPSLNEATIISSMPEPPKLEQQKKSGFFSKLFSKKTESKPLVPETLPVVSTAQFEMPVMPPPPAFALRSDQVKDANIKEIPSFNADNKLQSSADPDTIKLEIPVQKPITPIETEIKEDDSWAEEGEHFKENEMTIEGENYLESETPLPEIKGITKITVSKLKKAGVRSVEHLAKHDSKKLAKKTKLQLKETRKLIDNAKKISSINAKLKSSKAKDTKGISGIIKQLEEEKTSLDKLQHESDKEHEKILDLEGHKELIEVLEKLEKKRIDLVTMEEKLADKEIRLKGHDENYKRDMEHIEKLKRRLDHDVRERTQYLMALEKEYFQKAQLLAKRQSDIELRENGFDDKNKYAKEKEIEIKKRLNELEDRTITVEAKEKKFGKIMRDLENQDTALKEKEDDLMKREAEYLKKLDILENHEKTILKNLEEKRKSLESKEKEVELREGQLSKKQRNVDKQSVAVEYAKDVLEEQKGKVIDDEFEQYLHDQLGMMKESNITLHDMDLVKELKVPETSRKNKTVYELVDTCRDLIRSRRVPEAKMFYNQVREKYYGMDFISQKEKENVHNMVRTLYDEINLADIGK